MSKNNIEETQIGVYDDLTEDEIWEKFENNNAAFKEALPAAVRAFQETAVKYSHYNEIPAGIAFYNILGQIVKDFIHIPSKYTTEDTRIHFCWIQTSGTGKSTLWNFVGPVSMNVFRKINDTGKHPPLVIDNTDDEEMVVPDKTALRKFNNFSLTDYTDPVLVGKFKEEFEKDEDGKHTGEMSWQRIAGELEGCGLAHWDEFEYSGVFKPSNHQEKTIVYLNTIMNSLCGNSWVIKKSLSQYDNKRINCFSERSVFAMTYPPKNLSNVIAEKGVLQRMLLYVHEVPKSVQDKMRRTQIRTFGKKVEKTVMPIEELGERLFKIYNATKERFNEVGGDPTEVMKFSQDFEDVLLLEYDNMLRYLFNTRPEVEEIASNFTTRLLKILGKMSVLCSVASAPSITNKDHKFLVTGYNVRQAATLIRHSYMTLVDWLERSLKIQKRSIAKKTEVEVFLEAFKATKKDEEGFVSKSKFLNAVCKKSNKSKSQIYRLFKEIEHRFEEKKIGVAVYIKEITGDEQ